MSVTDQTELAAVHTVCKSCTFATYQKDTQTGCQLGRLEKFRGRGLEVVEACDEEKEFFIVNGRTCNAFRDRASQWAQKVFADNRPDAVRREIAVRADVVVHAGDFPTEQELLDALAATLLSLEGQTLRPASVIVMSNQDTAKIPLLHAWLAVNADGLNWRLTNVLERLPDESRLPPVVTVDLVANQLRWHYVTFLKAGETVKKNFFEGLDRAVNDELRSVAVVLAPLTVAASFYKMVDRNVPVRAAAIGFDGEEVLCDLTEKAHRLAQEKPGLVLTEGDLCA
jgi:hypothetical protein